MTTFHIHVRIDNLLAMSPEQFKSDYDGVFTDSNGKHLTSEEARAAMQEMFNIGQKIILSGGCDHFDPETGCLGHEENA